MRAYMCELTVVVTTSRLAIEMLAALHLTQGAEGVSQRLPEIDCGLRHCVYTGPFAVSNRSKQNSGD